MIKRHWLRHGVLGVVAAFTLSASAPVLATEPTRPAPAAVQSVQPTVNLNTASVEELMFLPGVGEKKAEAIVERRTRRPFRRPEEIMQIKGIGRSIYRKSKPYLRTSGPTTLSEKVRAPRKK